MWYINFVCYYFNTIYKTKSIITFIISHIISIPQFKYFYRISKHNDYDFYNIFLTAAVLKVGVGIFFGLLLNYLCNIIYLYSEWQFSTNC